MLGRVTQIRNHERARKTALIRKYGCALPPLQRVSIERVSIDGVGKPAWPREATFAVLARALRISKSLFSARGAT